ncbi:Y-family DNA polymerase [Alienimonas californiensis]|uniref:DNA polymerase IV n=1 Tax=Alienimonas californiensis TaxID=2527989 RepID=A0A517P6J2_9PLAN|nr:DNA polymerase Y family protein [Alienimonas californiensis]QDT15000.1 hypothetical protein CA12_10800 [Alienimonas californiensis]
MPADGCSPAGSAASPLVLHRAGRRGREVAARCRACRRAGVRLGMPLAEVPLHVPDAVCEEHDPAADRAALEDLAALFSRRLSPRVGVADAGDGAEPCGLAADVTGCAHLFGGERALVRFAVRLARSERLAARAAIAGCVGAAWGLARFGPDRVTILTDDEPADRLHALPAAALRLPTKLLRTLRELGVTDVGGVRGLPRASLPSRFGPVLAERLDRFFGRLPEPIEPVRPPAPVAAKWEGEHAPAAREAVGRLCDGLIAEVLNRLPESRGVREARFEFIPDNGGPARVVPLATARPTREAARLSSLLALRLDRLELPPPRRATLTVTAHERLRVARGTLFETGGEQARDLADLLETLSGRLGEDRVCRAEPTGDPLPERSYRLVPALNGRGDGGYPVPAGWLPGTRPVVLLDPPEPVRVLSLVPDGPPFRLTRRGRGTTEIPSAWGPERLQTGWWAGPRTERDYWRAELAGGERLWLFRDLKTGRWFLHGLFS